MFVSQAMLAAASLLIMSASTVLAGCALNTPEDNGTGLYGCKHYDATFDDSYGVPTVKEDYLNIYCQWGVRLDYIRMSWSSDDHSSEYLIEHGNPKGGWTHSERQLMNYDEIYSIEAFLCTKTKSEGKVCGLRWKFARDKVPFECGHTDAGGQGEYVFHRQRQRFHALRGTTVNNGLVINSIGWTVKSEGW